MPSSAYVHALESAVRVHSAYARRGDRTAALRGSLVELCRHTESTGGLLAEVHGDGPSVRMQPVAVIVCGGSAPQPPRLKALNLPVWFSNGTGPSRVEQLDPEIVALLGNPPSGSHVWGSPLTDEFGARALLLLSGRSTPYSKSLMDTAAPLVDCGLALLAATPPIAESGSTSGERPDESRIAEAEARATLLQSVLDALPYSVQAKSKDGRYLAANRQFRWAYGLDRTLLTDVTAEDLTWLTDSNRNLTLELDRQVLDSGEVAESEPFQATFPDGSTRQIQLTKAPLKDESGTLLGTVTASYDVTARVEAQARERESVRMLKAVFDAFPYHLHVKGLDLRYRMVNRVFAENSKMAAEDMIGRRPDELGYLSAGNTVQLAEQERSVLNSGEPRLLEEFHFTLPGGQEIYQSVLKYPMFDDAGCITGIVGIAWDTTDTIEAKRRAADSERLVQTMLDAYPHYVVVKDAELRYRQVSRRFAADAGLSPEDIGGRTLAVLSHLSDDQRRSIEDSDRKVLETGESIHIPAFQQRLPDGRDEFLSILKIPLTDTDGQVNGVLSFSMDVTETMLARRRAEERGRLLQMTIDTLQQRISLKDVEGHVVMANAAYLDIVRRSEHSVVGLTVDDLDVFDADVRKRLTEAEQEVVRTKSPVVLQAVPLRTEDGSVRFDDVVKSPWLNHEGSVIGIITAGTDITERLQSAEAIAAGQRLLRTVLDVIPHRISVRDLDERYLMVNEALAQRAGVRPEELVGRSLTDVGYLTEAARQTLRIGDEVALSMGQAASLPEIEIPRPDGSTEYMEVYKAAFRDAQGENAGVVTVTVDVTERLTAERQIRSHERLLQAVFDTIPHALTVKSADGRYLMLNPAYEGVFGLPVDALVGRRSNEVGQLPEETRAVIARDDEQLLANPTRTLQSSQRLPMADGSTRYLESYRRALTNEQGEVEAIVAIAVDVTERMLAQEREQRAHQWLRDAVEALPAVFMLFDADERLVLWNSRLEQFFPEQRGLVRKGMPYQEIASRSAPYNVDQESSDYVISRLHEFRGQSTPIVRRRKDGRWFQFYDHPMSDGSTVSLRFDISELKTQEQELRQAQKMEAVGQLTGGVAHDFNNLLTVIMGNLELLRRQVDNPEQSVALIDRSAGAVERGAALTQRLLAFSRRQTLRPRHTDLNALVVGLKEMMGRTLGETITVETQLEDGLWVTEIDVAQMENALLNLAINARDAMPQGGRVRIETRNVWLEGDVTEPDMVVTPGAYVLLSVSDTGSGIPKEMLERVFDPFFTTKEAGKGSGLGLSMVYGFVRQSSGHVKLQSEVGQGTTVQIYLPRSQGATHRDDRTPVTHGVPTGNGETVLIVEDDPHIAHVAKAMIEELGYATLQANTATAALSALESMPTLDVLFTDIVLPGGRSGIELAEQVNLLRPEVPVIFTSGYTKHEMMNQELLRPGAMLLEKPYRRHKLAYLLHEALRNARSVTDIQQGSGTGLSN